jgi:ferredoxin
MKKLFIEPGCISCGSCQFVCPEVFEVTDRSRIKTNADVEKHSEKIEEAASKCPVQVIVYEK